MWSSKIYQVYLAIFIYIVITEGNNIHINTENYWTEVDERFSSVSIDASIIAADFKKIDLQSPKLIALAKGLSGKSDRVSLYLRIGGSDQDFVVYRPTGIDSFPQYVLNNTEWDRINNFTALLGWKLIFGLNVLSERKSDGSWDPSNAIRLIRYSKSKRYNIDYQLGNEPDLFPTHENTTIPPDQLARDFALLSVILFIEGEADAFLIGPDVATLTRYNYFQEFLKNVENDVLDAVAYHFYYGSSDNVTVADFTSVDYMDRFLTYGFQAKHLIGNVTSLKDSPVWLTETSSTYGGGSKTIGLTYAAGFLYLDKLGLAAQLNLEVLVKHALIGGYYSLLDGKTYDPTPSYWIAAIYKQIVGKRVLNITGLLQRERNLRLYAHCINPHGGHGYIPGDIVVFGVNLKGLALLNFDGELSKLPVEQFLLTPAHGALTDRNVKLNLEVLKMSSPTSVPVPKAKIVNQPVLFPPFRYGFFVLRNAKAEACMTNSVTEKI